MYAVVRNGSRQHIVQRGDIVDLDRCDLSEGSPISLDDVLLVVDEDEVRIGRPRLEGAKVTGVVLGEIKGEKLVVFKYKRRKDSRCKTGHRQKYTRIRIDEIICS